jgi:hypothetical protein
MTSSASHAQESWDAIYLGGAKIGYVHVYLERLKHKGHDYQRVRVDIEQKLKRGRDTTITRLSYGTIETLEGQVLKLDTLTWIGEQKLRAHGDVIGGKMKLQLDGSGQQQEQVIPWSPDVRGPYAAEQSMAAKPMKEHEARSLKMFMPTLNRICDIQLQARAIEPAILGDGTSRPLLRIEQTTMLDGKARPEYDIKLWADSQGQILKQEQDLLGGYVQYRTTKEAALSEGGPIQLDLITATLIKTPRRIPDPEKTRYVKYRITLKDGEPAQVFPNDFRQTLLPEANKNTAILEVKSVGPTGGEGGPGEVDTQFMKANTLVTSNDSRVKSLAVRATRGVDDPWEKVVRINHFVFENVRDKNLEVAFAAASEVARNLSGDCTEHAVLSAAMCRAAGIPSRVVAGLIYVEEQAGFGFHMWNEVYINERWVAVDSSWDQTAVDAVHIKLSESSLEGVAPFEVLMPVIRVMGKLEIEPIETQ